MTKIELDYMEAVIRISKHLQSREIDWEQRRYEIAKDIMANKCLEQLADAAAMDFDVHDKEQVQADIAVSLADALVDRLKKR